MLHTEDAKRKLWDSTPGYIPEGRDLNRPRASVTSVTDCHKGVCDTLTQGCATG